MIDHEDDQQLFLKMDVEKKEFKRDLSLHSILDESGEDITEECSLALMNRMEALLNQFRDMGLCGILQCCPDSVKRQR